MTVIEALSQQTVPVERRILGRAAVLVDLLTEGWVHSSTAVLWGPGVTQSADPPPRYYTADRSDQRSDQWLSLRLILQRLGTCYHWHSIIRRPVSDQLIQQNLDFLPITTCISVIPPTLPSLWCSDTWMPCATLHCHWGSSWRAVRYQWASLSVLFSRLCSNSSPAQVSFRWGQYLAWTGNAATSLECKTRSPGVRNSHLHPALPLTNCLPIQMFRVCIMCEKWQIK